MHKLGMEIYRHICYKRLLLTRDIGEIAKDADEIMMMITIMMSWVFMAECQAGCPMPNQYKIYSHSVYTR